MASLICFFLGVVSAPLQGFQASSAADHVPANEIFLAQPLTLRWQYASQSTVNLTPVVVDDRIYLPLAAGAMVSLCTTNGQMFWRSEVGGDLSASPMADERGVYLASAIEEGIVRGSTPTSGALRALGREAGVTLWKRALPAPLHGALAMNETTVFGGAGDGRLYAIKKKTGDILWVKQFPAGFNSNPLVVDSHLYIGNDNGDLTALDTATGQTTWRYRTHGAVRGAAVLVNGIVYAGSTDGYVYALGAADGRLHWRARTGASVQAVAAARSGLLVSSLDNFVYLLSFTHGNRLWKRQLTGRLATPPLATADGALFTPLSADAGIVLDLRNGKNLNSLPLGEDISMVAAPVGAGGILLVTTRHGLLAFSQAASSVRAAER